jgi:hypothetical protein
LALLLAASRLKKQPHLKLPRAMQLLPPLQPMAHLPLPMAHLPLPMAQLPQPMAPALLRRQLPPMTSGAMILRSDRLGA